MKIIIVGCGRVGQTLAEKLNSDGNDVTVIDLDASKVDEITAKCDVMGLVGNGATHTILREAGINNTDLFIAVTNSDELNLLCCVIAKKESAANTIARLKNPEYSEVAPYLTEELGLAMVINPEYAAAEEIARVLRFPTAIQIEPFAKGKVELIKFRLAKDSQLANMSVKDLASKYKADVLVCTIERGEQSFIANGDFVFQEKDVVSIVATHKEASAFFKKINHKGRSIKNALIAGGGAIAHYLCSILERSGIALKVIDKDRKVCEELSAQWDKVNVICGNASNNDLMLEEGLDTAEAFVSLLPLDEENILLSLFAKEVSNGKIITKIKRTDYDNVISRLDLDTIICPKNITADTILRFVRATNNAKGSNIETMYNIIQDEVEALEFVVKDNSPIAGIPLYQLKFKNDVLIASIFRNGEVIVPRGNDVIQPGDAVIIVTKQLGLHDVSDILR